MSTAENTKILEGVFAINKPPTISSAQVLRDLQNHFNPSALFAPWLAREKAARDAESNTQHRRRSRAKRSTQVKIGHGGTLDPMATGVLIAGIGKGTKSLSNFLACTKSYEAVVLFGAATDTYDGVGKIVARAPYAHITEASVREALGKFTGKIMQRPPVFSALWIDGKRAYDYAREGKELPREIAEREVEVVQLEMVEWMEGGSHEFTLPEKEAEEGEMRVAEKLLKQGVAKSAAVEREAVDVELKRKRSTSPAEDEKAPESKKAKDLVPGAQEPDVVPESAPETTLETAPETATETTQEQAPPAEPASAPAGTAPTEASTPLPASSPSPPAARLRMTVTSGFYVRSLCHDLGLAVGSLGFMSALVRTRQGDFELGKNVLEYKDLSEGEKVWGPKVEGLLDAWNEKN